MVSYLTDYPPRVTGSLTFVQKSGEMTVGSALLIRDRGIGKEKAQQIEGPLLLNEIIRFNTRMVEKGARVSLSSEPREMFLKS